MHIIFVIIVISFNYLQCNKINKYSHTNKEFNLTEFYYD